jgi:hypothetical protein
MKHRRTTAVALIGSAAMLMTSAAPSRAALAGWTIYGSGANGHSVSQQAFVASGCNPTAPAAIASSGVDGVAINVSNWHNHTLVFSWYSTFLAQTIGGMYPTFMRGDCSTTGAPTASTSQASWSVTVPSDATWLFVMAQGTANVTLNLNQVI